MKYWQKKIREISRKTVFETGDSKNWIRAKDVVWLVNKVDEQGTKLDRIENAWRNGSEIDVDIELKEAFIK